MQLAESARKSFRYLCSSSCANSECHSHYQRAPIPDTRAAGFSHSAQFNLDQSSGVWDELNSNKLSGDFDQ